jgi:predicted metal-dependent hydrolase
LAATKVSLEGIGSVTIIRRRGLKNISLRVDHSGTVRLNLPWFVPKATGLLFVSKKHEWIKHQLSKKVVWTDGHEISGVRLNIVETDKSRSSFTYYGGTLAINVPKKYDSAEKQEKINKILTSFLKTKTEEIVIPKVNLIGAQHDCNIKSVSVRKLKSRWGSCDHKGNITLSLYLYTLPEDLWSYVICHELAHLQELNHSTRFWKRVEAMYPDYKTARKTLKNHSPGMYVS